MRRRQATRIAVAAGLLSSFAALAASFLAPAWGGPNPGTRVRTWLVGAELAAGTDVDWAGRYSRGTGYDNVSLVLAPRAGYAWSRRTCLGRFGEGVGAVEADGARVRLVGDAPPNGSVAAAAGDLLCIAWGDRRYLVPADQTAAFAQDVLRGVEPRTHRWGHYLVRRGDLRTEVHGRPTLPPDLEHVWELPPIGGRVVEVLGRRVEQDRSARRTIDTARVDAGSRDGCFLGMDVRAVPENESSGTGGRVVALEERSCLVELQRIDWTPETPAPTPPQPEVGLRVERLARPPVGG